ncbi:PhzF family phenazine biosynthesis protein [Streptomyces sp. PKU-EA00015]|uniref:PhzF family phenazine biosynthesis protein n=1 Tax=Streptomyces sp. PKU-EA00015 TaxID=2748326 RepID=UPI0015A10C74|nr:PhzF family phenazine biosynthesis protein [Streptomyces sp. PKU-EA00015]NWF27612.1 PhzF family phenazine biosynthesis protein [Streptomyces sp. PKU-EA00015]
MNQRDVSDVIDVLQVFCAGDGRFGNALGVVRDARRYPDQVSRQALAAELGYSETVFVDDEERGVVDIYTPGLRLPFAGHPLVGTAWLLDLDAVRPPAGEVWARHDGEFTWITARADWAPPRQLVQYASAAEVDALPAPPPGEGWLYAWAWEDEAAGRVRARAFPRREDTIVEDEATGAAALLLTDRLGRALNITQGRGSQILTAPGPDGIVEIGGRVRLARPASEGQPAHGSVGRIAPLRRAERSRLPHAVTMP